jgi:hypothetical protein
MRANKNTQQQFYGNYRQPKATWKLSQKGRQCGRQGNEKKLYAV